MRQAPILVLLAACAPEYELSRVAPPSPVDAAVPAPQRDAPTTPARQPRPTRKVEVDLGGGAPTAVADYLFVVDGSSSMQAVIDRVLDGIDALAAEGDAFPADARIAVLGTTPSHPRHRRRPHPATPGEDWLRYDPAFGDLVDGERIERFRAEAPPEWASRFATDGCEAWFVPGDLNDDGVACLVAHTQSLLYPVHVEAGLTALGQRLAEPKPLFRTGAAVNVIFVSDTHDPGLPPDRDAYEALVALRPTFADLEALALAQTELASFRVHAVAPRDKCSGEPWTGDLAYFDAADASGGATLDVCTATPDDYVAMVRRMVTEGAVPARAVVPLGQRGTVASVTVDGATVPFKLSRDGRAVVLEALPAQRSRVSVELLRAPRRE